MSYKEIPTHCVDPRYAGYGEYYVELNPNPRGGGNVEAFVECFKSAAKKASGECYGLPVNLILAQWGQESGWGCDKIPQKNQNWGNIIYSSSSNPPGNCGEGKNGWAKFYGKYSFAKGYGGYFKVGNRYEDLIDYLKDTNDPDAKECAKMIAFDGYCGRTEKDYQDYYETLCIRMKSVEAHSK